MGSGCTKDDEVVTHERPVRYSKKSNVILWDPLGTDNGDEQQQLQSSLLWSSESHLVFLAASAENAAASTDENMTSMQSKEGTENAEADDPPRVVFTSTTA